MCVAKLWHICSSDILLRSSLPWKWAYFILQTRRGTDFQKRVLTTLFGQNGGRRRRGSSWDREDLTLQKISGQSLSSIPLKTSWCQTENMQPKHCNYTTSFKLKKRTHDKLELYWWVKWIWIGIQLSNKSCLVCLCEQH